MFIKYLEGLKPLKITENKNLGLDFRCNISRLRKTEMECTLNTYKLEKGQLLHQLDTGKRWSSPKRAKLQPQMSIN